MKPIFGVVAVLSWIARCHDVSLPIEQPAHGPDHLSDAGANVDAGVAEDAACDAAVSGENDAATRELCNGPAGLYQDGFCDDAHLAPGVRKYRPKYELWSDGATKQRYIQLPPGEQIDATTADRWTFPVGTRLWKTFSVDGRRIETRLIWKNKGLATADVANWTLETYAWSEDARSVTLVPPEGIPNAIQDRYDIPSQMQCVQCHTLSSVANTYDAVNGFGAIQLNHHPEADGGITLKQLLDEGRLKNVAGDPYQLLETAVIPGDAVARSAIGYLHANCGNCHGGDNPRGYPQGATAPLNTQGLALWVKVGAQAVADTPMFQSGMCKCLLTFTGKQKPTDVPEDYFYYRILPGNLAESALPYRMSVRPPLEGPNMRLHMPPIGSKIVDSAGLAQVEHFIDGLPTSACVPEECPEYVPPPPMPAPVMTPATTPSAPAP